MVKRSEKLKPPGLAQRILLSFLREDIAEEVLGDLDEQFHAKLKKKSLPRAKLNYWHQVFNYLRPFAIKKLTPENSNHLSMFRHNFIISARNLKRNKTYSAINILGLALGITCATVIFILVKYHLSFDNFHAKADRIYRIITELHREDIIYVSGAHSPLGEAIRNDLASVEKVAMVLTLPDEIVSVSSSKDPAKFQENVAFAEPGFFDILNFPLLRGNKKTLLDQPNSVVITEKISRKYFGDRDPIGQTIRLGNKMDFIVTGILQNLPANTSRRQEIYLPFSSLKDYAPWFVENWWLSVNGAMQCFVRLRPGVSADIVNKSLAGLSKKYYNEQNAKHFRFKVQHLSDIHFNPRFGGYIEKKNLLALAFIGLFLIVTCCVNFINLATTQALGRSKEIGVKKVLGGLRKHLFWQFMIETALISMLAMGIAITLTYLSLPHVNQLLDTQFGAEVFQDASLLTFLALLLFAVIFFSGSYPGLILAGFKPLLALKGKLTQRHIGGFQLRRGLVVAQFAISQLLIIGTIVIANQMHHIQNSDMGFEKEAIIMLPVHNPKTSVTRTLQNQFLQIPGVEQIAFCGEAPAFQYTSSTNIRLDSRDKEENFSIYYKAGDHNYVSLFGLQIVAGRNLHPSDTIREYLINETTIKRLGLTSNIEAIGKSATINGQKGTIVGVVKDFHNKSLHKMIDPFCITTRIEDYRNCALKINPASLNPTLTQIEKVWNEAYPNQIYKYGFLNEQIARFYKTESRLLWLIQVFAAIAIIIGCLGLYGLVSFMTSQKTKEIGVRKVLGASIKSILWQFGKEFGLLLLIAFIIAAPVAWLVMSDWLQDFAYRIEIGADIFLLGILITVAVATLTVGYKSLKAALTDPVNSLRSE